MIGNLPSSYMGTSSTTTSARTTSAVSDVPTLPTSNNTTVLTMDNFLQLFVAQLQNQDPSNPMEQSEMMNQLVQMTTISSMNTMVDVSMTTYAASLVGKEVTVANINSDDEVEEIVGTVTATGLFGGSHVIFIDDKSYYLSQIMAVGKLPKVEEEPEVDTDVETPDVETPESENSEVPDVETPDIEVPETENSETTLV